MKRLKIDNMLALLLAVAAVACGPAEDKGKKAQLEKAGDLSGRLDAQDFWDVEEKTCGRNKVDPKSHETYKLADSYFVMVEGLSEDANHLCKLGHVFMRTSISSENFDDTYKESGVLDNHMQVKMTKKSCWTKQDGKVVEPARDEMLESYAKKMPYELALTQNEMKVWIKEHDDCLDGVLTLNLTPRRPSRQASADGVWRLNRAF